MRREDGTWSLRSYSARSSGLPWEVLPTIEAYLLTGVGCDIRQDANLGHLGVVLRIDACDLWMDCFIALAWQAGIAFIQLDVGVALLEVDQVVVSWHPGGHFVGSIDDSIHIADI